MRGTRSLLDPEVISLDDDGVSSHVDLPEAQIKALDTYRKKHGISRAEAVRRAVAVTLSGNTAPEDGLSERSYFRQQQGICEKKIPLS